MLQNTCLFVIFLTVNYRTLWLLLLKWCLLSARYRGPEQEIWSLGVTLYTLVMRENPFESIDDAITASYSIPLDVSIGLNSSPIT